MTCRICRFATELDDVVLRHAESCVCLRCYGRETRSQLAMSRSLHRHIAAALAACEDA